MVDFTGLFANGDHVDEQGREGAVADQGFGEGTTVADLADDFVEFAAEAAVLGGVAGEFEGAKQGQAVANEVGHGFEELDVESAGDDGADERELEFHPIPSGLVGVVVLPGFEEDARGDEGDQDDDPPFADEGGGTDEDGGSEGHFAAAAVDQGGELRNEDGDENDRNADARENEEGGVDHREDEAGLELGEGFEVVGLALEDVVERAGRLASGGERAIERAEAGADFFQRDGEVDAVADDLADFEGDGLEVAELLAVFHRLEGGLQLETGAEHVGKFFGEEHDFLTLQLDRAIGDGGFFGFGLVVRLGFAAGLFGRGCGRRFHEADGLETFAVEHAQGFGTVRGVDFAGGDGSVSGESFVGEERHRWVKLK